MTVTSIKKNGADKMTVTFIKKNDEKIVYNNAYEVCQHGSKYIVVVYPDVYDHNVESEMKYRRDELESVVITFE